MKTKVQLFAVLGILILTNGSALKALDTIPETGSKQNGEAANYSGGVEAKTNHETAAIAKRVASRENKEPTPGTSITVFSPNGGECFAAGDTMRIKWTADTDSVDDVMIWLLLDGGLRRVLITSQFSVRPIDDGWGDYPWVIPPDAMKDTVSLLTDQAGIQLHQYRDTHFEDYSDEFFTIGEGVAAREDLNPAVSHTTTAGEFSVHWSQNTVAVSGVPASHPARLHLVDLSGRILGTTVTDGPTSVVKAMLSGRAGVVLLHIQSGEWSMSRRLIRP